MARLEDDAIMARFVRDYLSLLDERVAVIAAQVESGDTLSANISLLSLESSSSMVGAEELANTTSLLRGAIERRENHVLPTLVAMMTTAATRVHEQLQRGQ